MSFLDLNAEEKLELKSVALSRFRRHVRKEPDWAIRYIAFLFIVDSRIALTTLRDWLKTTPARRRKSLAEKAVPGPAGGRG